MRRLAAQLVLGAALVSCAPKAAVAPGPSALPSVKAETAKVAAGIGESATAIDQQRARIEAKAPETKPESAAIGAETEKLRGLQQRLEAATASLAAETDRNKGLERTLTETQAALDKASKEVERLKEERNSLLSYALAGLGVLFFLGIPFSILVLRSARAALACAAMFALAVAAQWLLAWAFWIAIGVVAVFALGSAFYLYVHRKAIWELVSTVEAAKAVSPQALPQLKERANAIQSTATKRVVEQVRESLRKADAEGRGGQ